MNNEQLLQMYDAIRQQPDLLVKAAARKRLINFARYMPVSYTHLTLPTNSLV